MPIKQLSEEQVRTLSLRQKDTWWFSEVFRRNTDILVAERMPMTAAAATVLGIVIMVLKVVVFGA